LLAENPKFWGPQIFWPPKNFGLATPLHPFVATFPCIPLTCYKYLRPLRISVDKTFTNSISFS